MEVQFKKSILSCLDSPAGEVRTAEQTQEIKLTDSMPDIGRVVAAWGQCILRGKEWRGDAMAMSAGMLVWVLYAPEDGSAERCLNSWIPFQMKWDLPVGTPEGIMRMRCLPRFVDARSVSPRKIMVRAGMSALAEAFVPMEAEHYSQEVPVKGVELLEKTYPVLLNREAGEKRFALEETLSLPDSAPPAKTILCFRLDPRIGESSVLTDKLVFRGTANLHILYRSEEGQLAAQDFPLPFSQYVQLDRDFERDARADIGVSVTAAELDLDDEGSFRFKGGFTAQYVLAEQTLLRLTQDAYSPGRDLEWTPGEAELPTVLDIRRESISGEKTLPESTGQICDVWLLPDFPARPGLSGNLTAGGMAQLLTQGEDGLRSTNVRWEEERPLPMDENCRMTAVPLHSQAQTIAGSGQLLLNTRMDYALTTMSRQVIPMITGLELGEKKTPDPNRPSLILRRAGREGLWELAKSSGTSMDSIRSLNHLEKDPEPGQLLLIPVV